MTESMAQSRNALNDLEYCSPVSDSKCCISGFAGSVASIFTLVQSSYRISKFHDIWMWFLWYNKTMLFKTATESCVCLLDFA